MFLTKAYLNELVQKKQIIEEFKYSKSSEPENYDIFISYNYHDQAYAKKIVGLLAKYGYSAYADYNDLKLDRNNVNVNTAKRLVAKMKQCKALFYLHSKSASVSKWCPWEVGIFSGIKNFRCANLAILDRDTDTYKNQEYLGLYPYVDFEKYTDSGQFDFWINTEDGKYVSLRNWLNGQKPKFHKNN